jgi:hydrogenase maturation protein HypF
MRRMRERVGAVTVAAEEQGTKSAVERLKVIIRGAVQGVGFRPFVYRLASETVLRGWVLNSSQGVFIEVEGERAVLEEFLLRLEQEKPPLAIIQSLEFSFLDPVGYPDFVIRHSEETGEKTVLILPDIATCPECYREVGDADDRRYRYPFTNCTHCGPRFTIVRELPYDRPNTSMARFPLCPDCRREYENPLDRRFHAQPVACHVCGPQVALYSGDGYFESVPHLAGDEAIQEAAQAVREGRILAMKGLGGFLLIVDARNEGAVQRLRERKQREEKPFALLYPSLEVIKEHCLVSPLEERVLTSPESPIVLLRRWGQKPGFSQKPGFYGVCDAVAPGNPHLGVMLPYTPLHDLLMQELGFPVVATSGNRSDEPICIDENEARERLGGIADLFLVHNRPIVRHCDDSVVRVVLGQELVLRRARGYAPLPVSLKREVPPILAVGAHLKNTIALSVGRQVFLSQHIGDLDTPEACAAFERVIADFLRLYEVEPVAIAHDLHPDYFSTKYAQSQTRTEPGRSIGNREPVLSLAEGSQIAVQHHHAHLASCLAENEVEGPALGVTWDGTGYGSDGTVWGGEFLWGDAAGFERVAHLRTFRLPGGEAAVKEPRRTALGVLWEHFGPQVFEWEDLAPVVAFSRSERSLLRQMLERGVNSPVTSSAGRLFDAVAALVGLRQENRFEAQAAMMLEYAVDETVMDAYPLPISNTQYPNPQPLLLDWGPLLEALLADLRRGVSVGVMAARFHNALVEGIVAVARTLGAERAALSGGCFQNRILLERAHRRLTDAGLRVYVHQRIPPNDGGISLGQVAVAARTLDQFGGV